MSKRKRLAKLDKHECHEVNQSSDEKTCNLKFSNCDDNKYSLCDLGKAELKKFVAYAKKVENMKWVDIKKSKGLNYESIYELKPPSNISEEIVLKSMRVDGEFRVFGYRMNESFYIVWFDPNHELT